MAGSSDRKSTVVIGAGPAGIAAATELLQRGFDVTLIDEFPAPGGSQGRWDESAPAIAAGGTEPDQRLTLMTATQVWGLFDDNEVAIYRDDRAEILRPDNIILAAGAIERTMAFPGWELPGILTAGGAMALIARDGVLPGRRFLLAGTGPLLLAAATEIADAGGEVAAVIEGCQVSAPLRNLHQFLGQTQQFDDGRDYLRELRQRGIPLVYGAAVTAAEGEGHVREATVQQLDDEWRPVDGTETTYSIDTVCLHLGFESATELARMVDCQVGYDVSRGGWFVEHDDMMRSSRPGIYVAGQLAGIGSFELAQATGRLAGLAVATDLGHGDDEAVTAAMRDAQAVIESERSTSGVLNGIYLPRPGLSSVIKPETTICRCEGVLAAEIDAAITSDATTLNDVKRYTRCGMGACQGRICSPIVARYLEHRTSLPVEAAGLITARPPVKPVPLGALATLAQPEPVM